MNRSGTLGAVGNHLLGPLRRDEGDRSLVVLLDKDRLAAVHHSADVVRQPSLEVSDARFCGDVVSHGHRIPNAPSELTSANGESLNQSCGYVDQCSQCDYTGAMQSSPSPTAPQPRPFDPSAPAKQWVLEAEKKPWGSDMPDGILYRFFDHSGLLLYVGITSGFDPISRWHLHKRNSPWWPLAAFTSLKRISNDATTRAEIERAVIVAERPRFNKQHSAGWQGPDLAPNASPEVVVAELRRYLTPQSFTALVSAFKAEPDAP